MARTRIEKKHPRAKKMPSTRGLSPKQQKRYRRLFNKKPSEMAAWRQADISSHTPNPGAKGNYSQAGGSSGTRTRLPTRGNK